MPRPRRDGAPPAPPRKLKLTDKLVRSTPVPSEGRALTWDSATRGLALAVHPSGRRTWRLSYRYGGRLRVFTIGPADVIDLAEARQTAWDLLGQVARGGDPAGDKRQGKRAETFKDVALRYREHAMKVNKSWQQAATLVDKHLIPRWSNRKARDITRSDVRAMMRAIEAPVVANMTLAFASAIFTWAIKQEVGDITVNPCNGVPRNAVTARERVLSDAEVPLFWAAFDDADMIRSFALKTLLLTGQRPGEVCHMRREHISDGWWELPGQPVPSLGWPGTKNAASHRVWLTAPVLALIDEIADGATTGFAFPGDERGKRPIAGLDATMRDICTALGVADKVTPHDLRRTHGTMITALGFGREAMNRIQNHKEGGIASVYDRHGYSDENKKVQDAVTRRVMELIGKGGDNVAALRSAG